MARDYRRVQLALSLTNLSTHKFPIAAVIYAGSIAVGVGVNKSKTHPKQTNPYTHTYATSTHAELVAVLATPSRLLHGATIYVARRLGDGSAGLAKPCLVCQEILRAAGVRRVVYTSSDICFDELLLSPEN